MLLLGVGSFAQSVGQALADDGAGVRTYLTRPYGHYAPSLVGPVFTREAAPNPCALLREKKADVVIPQSIDWAQAAWAEELTGMGTAMFGPTGEAMKIERERDYARRLCEEFKIPFPQTHVASNRLEAEAILAAHPRPFMTRTRCVRR